MNSRDVSVTGTSAGELSFRLHESGTPAREAVLFLHGSGPGATGRSNWARIIADLADAFYCLAPDMIGFGDSSHPADPPQGMGPFNELRAEAVWALLDTLDVQRVHLVGNSMGGQIALLMTLAQPDRIGKVVLMGSGGAPDMPVSSGLAHLRGFYAAPTEESLKALLTQFVYDLEPLAGTIDQVARERMTYIRRQDVQRSHAASFNPDGPRRTFSPDELATIGHDVLVLHGRDDRIIPVQASHYFASTIPNANLFVFGRCGHWTQIEYREKFENLLTKFLEGTL